MEPASRRQGTRQAPGVATKELISKGMIVNLWLPLSFELRPAMTSANITLEADGMLIMLLKVYRNACQDAMCLKRFRGLEVHVLT